MKCLHKTQFGTQCWGQKRPHASSEMDKLTSNTNEEDQIMASVTRDLGEDLKVNHLWSFKSGNTKLVRLLPKIMIVITGNFSIS